MRNKHEGQGDDFWQHGRDKDLVLFKFSEVMSFFKIV